ncbi:hypothetical protein KQX54_020645 [Cotesia glomerata]|uniref:Uncharacterized protein n=1 Tax=Cotesia glomerata TaxID=32391 RepID=A0AAV7IU99_COTGL|nr:hypothetical protein KQX54_020645 [Cotesia glomerata]
MPSHVALRKVHYYLSLYRRWEGEGNGGAISNHIIPFTEYENELYKRCMGYSTWLFMTEDPENRSTPVRMQSSESGKGIIDVLVLFEGKRLTFDNLTHPPDT